MDEVEKEILFRRMFKITETIANGHQDVKRRTRPRPPAVEVTVYRGSLGNFSVSKLRNSAVPGNFPRRTGVSNFPGIFYTDIWMPRSKNQRRDKLKKLFYFLFFFSFCTNNIFVETLPEK